jgi:hypothetical protein
MHPLYYYFGAPDSDSADDTYDPTRECFNIDVAITSDSEDEAAVEGRNTPPQVELPAEQDEAQFLADQGMQLEQIRELQDRIDEERGTRTWRRSSRELVTSIVASLRIGESSPRFSIEPARTWS